MPSAEEGGKNKGSLDGFPRPDCLTLAVELELEGKRKGEEDWAPRWASCLRPRRRALADEGGG